MDVDQKERRGLKVTDHWHEYMLSVTILTLTIRLSATCSVFPILDEWTVDHVTVTLGNYLGFIKILTWSWQLLSKNIKVQQFEVSGSTRTLCHNVPVDSYKKKSCLIPSENKMRNGKRGLMLAFSGVISAHSVPICAQIQPAHLWREKKRHPKQGEREGSTLALLALLLLFQWWQHCPSQSNVFWKNWP